MLIHRICKALKDLGVPYAIVGGYAVALHGAIRGTVDVDFVIQWTWENLQKTEAALHQLGLVSRLPLNAVAIFQNKEEFIQNKNLIAWNFYNPSNPSEQIDLIITYDLSLDAIQSIPTRLGEISVLSKSHLIKMKKQSGRPQDLADIQALESL